MNRKLFIVLMVMTLAMQPGCNKNDNPKESLPAVLARLDWGEGTTYVIGHKTPDADAVFSAIAYADLMKTLGYQCEARINGPVNRETAFIADKWGIDIPAVLPAVEPGTRLILTDHADYTQSVDGARQARLLQVIDHHGVGDIPETAQLYYKAMPVGATCTIVYDSYLELGVPISEKTARVLLAGLISDTRNLKKSTTTALDSLAMKDLSRKAGLSAAEVAAVNKEMVAAGKDLSGMSDREIFLADYKGYNIEGILLGIGNMDSSGKAEENAFIDRMLAVMPEVLAEKELAMIFGKAEIGKGTYILYYGEGAREIAEKAFGASRREGVIHSDEKLGRKTHVVPGITEAIRSLQAAR